MGFVELTTIDGQERELRADQIVGIRDYPEGQTMLDLEDGTTLQVLESVAHVKRLVEQGLKDQ